MGKLQDWWAYNPEEASSSSDSPHAPIRTDQRRDTFPLLTMAFGWGFLITGLLIGGSLGNGLPFEQIVQVTLIGNFVNFVIGAFVGYIGYKTACNSGLLYKLVYGSFGAAAPSIFVALLTLCWQGIIVGAFGFAWTQSFDSGLFYAVAIFAGLLFTFTTYFGMKGLEIVSIPATFILIAVGLYAGYLNVSEAGGWEAFLELSRKSSEKEAMTMTQGVNLVIGSWIVGAIVMPEYTRFAKKAWVAIAIPFIVMIVAQWFLQIIGAMGGVVSGTYDFTTYMLAQGAVIGGIGVIAMSFALWTTGDANLYLPAVQTASVFKRPQKAMTVVCGIIGTILGLGIYAHFVQAIDLLASIAPPLIGPLLVGFYLTERDRFRDLDMEAVEALNWRAFAAYFLGAASTFVSPDYIAKSLLGLFVSMLVYFVFSVVAPRK
jgi:cytosine permease